jgi:hypothetical protein
MSVEVSIERRFRGPPNSANGGYACGVVAEGIEGVVTATLRRPPPLGVSMSLAGDDGKSLLMEGDVLIAEAVPGTLDLVVPAVPPLEIAVEASRRFSGFERHPFPGCYVCGPEREPGDGLRIFPGRYGPAATVAAHWTPDESLGDRDGLVQRRHVWAALDCPSYFGLADTPVALLGRLTARVDRLPEIGEQLVVIGWPIGADGRKHHAGSALASADGMVLAAASATWIEIDRLPL